MVHRVCRMATVLRTAVLRHDRCEKTKKADTTTQFNSRKRIFGKASCKGQYSLLSWLNCCRGQETLPRATVPRSALRADCIHRSPRETKGLGRSRFLHSEH